MHSFAIRFSVAAALLAWPGLAQNFDPGPRLRDLVDSGSEGKLKLTFEQRGRYESRTGTNFGQSADVETGLYRTRVGLSYQATDWLKFSGMMQDTRAPWYGPNAPNNVRDSADLHEAFVEIGTDSGFGLNAGRMMLNFGDGRMIGTPQWGNNSRTYDQARVYYRTARVRIEALLVSPVKVRIDEFNQPVLGERAYGLYNVFTLAPKRTLDIYILHHTQNRIGGFTGGARAAGTDRLETTSFGGRISAPFHNVWKLVAEAVAQTGDVGPASNSSQAAVATLVRKFSVAGRGLDVTAEYKYASGTENPQDATHTSTFDQVFAANHDRYGHQDLFGWRNSHNVKLLGTLAVNKKLAVNLMYGDTSLVRVRDGLYNGNGKMIFRSANGTAGRHVGQEADLFLTYKVKSATLGCGYGRFFKGDFIRNATTGVGPTYLYIFHSYSF